MALEIADLCFAYPDGKRALDGISLHVNSGESIGLVGPNGAGKTSFFLCLAGVLRGRAATFRVVGLDLTSAADRSKLPTKLGIVFQNSDDQLFSSTVGDDVAFGPLNLRLPADEVKRRVDDALKHVGLAGFGDRVPFHLSGGEKRRAALAGVLAMQPEMLLLDEPSMFLDPRGRRELMALLTTLPVTKIIASHDLDLIMETCSRVIVLDHGKIVADGETRTVLADAALMESHGLEVPWRLRGNHQDRPPFMAGLSSSSP